MDNKFFIDALVMVIKMVKEKGMAIAMYAGDSVLVYDEDNLRDIAKELNQEIKEVVLETTVAELYHNTHQLSFNYQGVEFCTYITKGEEK